MLRAGFEVPAFRTVRLRYRGETLLLVAGAPSVRMQVETVLGHCDPVRLSDALGLTYAANRAHLGRVLERQLAMGSAFFVEESAPSRLLDAEEIVDISDLVDHVVIPPEPDPRRDERDEFPAHRNDRIPVFPEQAHAIVFEVVERSGVPVHGRFRLADAGNLHSGRVDDGEPVTQPVAAAKVRLELHGVALQTEGSNA
jgi:hypothetical protein